MLLRVPKALKGHRVKLALKALKALKVL